MPNPVTTSDESTIGTAGPGRVGGTDGAWMPSTQSLFGDSDNEARIVRDSIKARLFPGLSGPRSHSAGALGFAVPRVGRFSVLRKLGEGGMGVVFLAYDEELDRKIAVKVLRRTTERDVSRARLTREAQALARLSHPNVVQIYEVGDYEGQTFIAMEYVAGQTLRRWLEQPRPWREVLAALIQAGRGLEAAHVAGLVHRDFKPDNVLVGEDGRVRVLDFGLVRADLGFDSVEEPSLVSSGERALDEALTRTGSVLGTPVYMSPEQHLGEQADALGDQFSFCVTAWEALHGQRPFGHRSRAELIDAVLTKAIASPPKGSPIPRTLRAHVERGLEPERDRRWPAVSSLLVALEAELAPRRRTVWALGAVAVLAAGLAAWIALAWAGEQPDADEQVCALGPEQLDGTWDAAQADALHRSFAATELGYADEAEAIVRASLDGWAADWIAASRDACEATRVYAIASEELLDRRGACLAEQRLAVAGLVAVLVEADAQVVQRAAELLAGVPEPQECARIELLDGRPALPEDPDARAAVLAGQGKLAEVRALRAAGRREAAEAALAGILAGAPPVASVDIDARAQAALIELEYGRGRQEDLVARVRSLAAEAELAGDDVLAADLRVELALLVAGKLAGPRTELWLVEDARVALARLGTSDERRGAQLELASAQVDQHRGRLAQSGDAYRELISRADARDWSEIATVASLELAAVLDGLGDYELAEAAYANASERARQRFGEGHPRVAYVDLNHALHAIDVGDEHQARRLLAKAEAAIIDSQGRDSLEFARVEVARAKLAVIDGQWSHALALLESSRATYQAKLGVDHEETARLLDFLATLRYYNGDLDGALVAYEAALKVLERRFEPGHETLVVLHANLGDTLLAQGRLPQAQRAFDESLAQLELGLGLDHPVACVALAGRGEIALARGQADAAIPDLEAALALLRRQAGDAAELAQTQMSLARALAAVDREPERVEQLAVAARSTFVDLDLTESVAALDLWRASLD
ncbi:Serine/threonine-protein kinase StkP [Enhygromyxa salina]|uniref:Serine/threonine-protein kinase StkP n=1 Tax=Enhygromyxa salina TaxID=215803 RepID=A0A2S9YHZ7_9BACT|nr:serine/threonine-protein kinase [Enhygromyxa salina]PRQ04743.1 Serine/threonine-protein kinase StkP [Enhygromyxa salina]